MKSLFRSPLLNVLLFSLFWAIEIFNAKLAFIAGANLMPFTLQSAVFTLLIVSVYTLLTRYKELRQIPFRIVIWLVVANAIHMGIGGFFSNAGVQLTSAINAGFLMQLTLVSGILFAWIILKEKMTGAKILAMGTIILGTFFLTTKGKLIVPHIGDLLLLLACVAWGLGGVLIRKVLKNTNISGDLVSFFRPVGGIPVLLFFIAASPLYPHALQSTFQVNIFAIHHIFYVISNGFLMTFVWIFVNRSLQYASISYIVILSAITPILVAIVSLVYLHEHLDWIQCVGICLIIIASFIAQFLKFDKH